MEQYFKKGHLTLIPGGAQSAEPVEEIDFSRVRTGISRAHLAWFICAKLILLASVLYVMGSFN